VKALGITAFVLTVVWCFANRNVRYTLAVLALYLGLLDGYVKLSTGSNTVTLARDVLIAAIALGAFLRSDYARSRMVLPPLSGYVIVFCVVVLTELANPGANRGLTAGFAGIRQHLEFVPLFFLGYAFVRTDAQIRRALLILVICASAGGVVSYIQSRLTPAQFAAWGPGYSQRVLGTGIFTGAGRVGFTSSGATVRPFGLGSDSGAGAATAALALPALLALLMTARGGLRWGIGVMSIGVGLAIATSGSRSGIITSVASLLAFGLIAATSKNAIKAMVGVTLGVAIIGGAFADLAGNGTSQRAQSITPGNALSTFQTERGASVNALGGLISHYPLGVGLGTVGPAASFGRTSRSSVTLNSEDEWNFLVVETGVAGLVTYIAFMLRLLWLSVTRIRFLPDPAARLYLAAVGAPLFGALVADFSGPTSAGPPLAPFVWFAAGVLGYRLVANRARAPLRFAGRLAT
jgi:hypothetical protein